MKIDKLVFVDDFEFIKKKLLENSKELSFFDTAGNKFLKCYSLLI